jgi:hypothetical protein
MAPDSDYRRINDAHIKSLYDEMHNVTKKVDVLQAWVTENSQVTRDVRDLLSTFQVSRSVANWIVKVGGAGAIVYAGFKGWIGK